MARDPWAVLACSGHCGAHPMTDVCASGSQSLPRATCQPRLTFISKGFLVFQHRGRWRERQADAMNKCFSWEPSSDTAREPDNGESAVDGESNGGSKLCFPGERCLSLGLSGCTDPP